jgi:hypothetical protein
MVAAIQRMTGLHPALHVGRQVLGSDLAALLLPQADQGLFLLAHAAS